MEIEPSEASSTPTASDTDSVDEELATITTTATAATNPFEVYLKVYDASSATPFLRLFGIGLYRSSVLVHGREYSFRPESKNGPREYGIVTATENQLRWCQGLRLRATIQIGPTQLDQVGVSGVMFQLQNEYNMVTYHPLTKNSHHFADRVCRELTGSATPRWVNRVTVMWPLCKCFLPPDPAEVNKLDRRILDLGLKLQGAN